MMRVGGWGGVFKGWREMGGECWGCTEVVGGKLECLLLLLSCAVCFLIKV